MGKPGTKKHIEFIREDSYNPKGTTCAWDVIAISNGTPLGLIKWYSPWRQYCFFPECNTLYVSSCLNDIINFMKENRKKRK